MGFRNIQEKLENNITYVAATTSISGVNADNTVIQVTPVVFAFSLRQNTSVINVSQNFADSTWRIWGSAPSTDLKEKYERYRLTQLSENFCCLPFNLKGNSTLQYYRIICQPLFFWTKGKFSRLSACKKGENTLKVSQAAQYRKLKEFGWESFRNGEFV